MRKLFVILMCVAFVGGCAGMAPAPEMTKAEIAAAAAEDGSVETVAAEPEQGEKAFRREVVTMRDEAGKPILYFLTIYNKEDGAPAGFYILDREKKVVVGGKK